MLKRFLWILAVVLVANGAALATVVRNGRGAPDAVLTLTEREMRVTDLGADTTGMTLTLTWAREPRAAWIVVADRPVLPWFDRAKLTSIGFDCSFDLDAPGALQHYTGPTLAPRTTYLVFDYDTSAAAAPDAPAPVPPESASAEQPVKTEYAARLRPIDAGNDSHALRSKYPDTHRYLITAGVVRLRMIRKTPQQPAKLEGVVMQVIPSQVYVPQQMQRIVMAAVGRNASQAMPSSALSRPPRYEVTVEYGSRLLPRIVGVRAIGP